MTKGQKIQLEMSERRESVNALLAKDEINEEERGKLSADTKRLQELETEHRAAIAVEGAEPTQTGASTVDAETRERVELRSKATLTNYLLAAARGRLVSGAEAELAAAAGIDGGIPLELWDVAENRTEDRATADAPSTTGVNLDQIRPAVFANSIASRLGIEMPRVESGAFATATITTSQEAGSHAKGSSAAGVAGAMTVTSVTAKRISARLELTLEDIATVGASNFESILRQNLSLVLSDELDDQAINGAGGNSGADLNGIFHRLTAPTAPTAVATFDDFAAAHAGGCDGLWANSIKDVSIVVGPASYVLASKTFQSATNYKGELSAASYAMTHTGGFWTNKRMPDAVSTIQQGILYRKGRSMMGGSGAMRTAVCPHWNQVSIDDVYSGSAKGERYFTVHVLLGDVILVQPDAYAQIAFKVA